MTAPEIESFRGRLERELERVVKAVVAPAAKR